MNSVDIKLKIQYQNQLRVIKNAPGSLQDLKATLYEKLGLQNCVIRYEDEEGDLITIDSTEELADAYSFSKNNR